MSDTPDTDAAWADWTYAGPGVHANFARKLERERDEARKERNAALSDRDAWARLCGAVDCYTPSTAEPYEALKLQRDELRAEVERLKRQLMGDNESALMLSDMTEEIQQLRADKARLDWIKALDCDSPVWGVLCDTTKLRETIDAAMKGEL